MKDAPAQMGQSITDFVVCTVVQAAQKVLNDRQVTQPGKRDRQAFAAMLDEESSQPGELRVIG
ncbi:MAG: DUF1778 domain-containing protein [Planctomycetaceae bacterium]